MNKGRNSIKKKKKKKTEFFKKNEKKILKMKNTVNKVKNAIYSFEHSLRQ